jgi:hypothetical protein
MIWTGTHHAPVNSATLQILARAVPEQMIRLFADPSHLAELQADPSLTACRQIDFTPIKLSPHFRFKTHIVSLRRGIREFATMWAALRRLPPGEPGLLFLTSTTPTAIFAASVLARLVRRCAGVVVGLHGNLNDLTAWRSRNPLVRLFDMPSVLRVRRRMPQGVPYRASVRFIVLEQAIRRKLETLAPEAAQVTDVLPHPVIQTEIGRAAPVSLTLPLHIGLVGQATEAKGITPFLELARELKARHGDRLTFEVVGCAPPGSDLGRFAALDAPVTHQHLSREAFRTRLARLHFVCLPLQQGYYSLSASGAFVDAITWLKPVIACRVPIVEDAFVRFGELGHLCDDVAAMRAVIEHLVVQPDPARYAMQVAAMRRARDARLPDALARDCRGILTRGFPRLFAPPRAAEAADLLRTGTRG